MYLNQGIQSYSLQGAGGPLHTPQVYSNPSQPLYSYQIGQAHPLAGAGGCHYNPQVALGSQLLQGTRPYVGQGSQSEIIQNTPHQSLYPGNVVQQHQVNYGQGQFTQPSTQTTPTGQVHFREEFRCSPVSGRTYKVLVPVQSQVPTATPDKIKYEWRCHPETGQTYQVLVRQGTPKFYSEGQDQVFSTELVQPVTQGLSQPEQGHLLRKQQYGQGWSQVHSQDVVQGIIPLVEGGGLPVRQQRGLNFLRNVRLNGPKQLGRKTLTSHYTAMVQ